MAAGAIGSFESGIVARLRSLSLKLVLVATGLAILFVAIAGVPVTAEGATAMSLFFAVLMVVARFVRGRREDSPLADAFTAIALVWIVGLACGAISLMGVRLGRPLVDPMLLAVDHGLGFDPIHYSNLLGDTQAIWPLRYIYTLSLPMLFIGMLLQAMLGRRLALWRSVTAFGATLLATSLISILTPAKGFYVYAPAELVAKMPATAGTYFWKTFDLYHGGGPVVLGLGSIDGVVSFPSFHTIVALMTAALWRGHRLFPVFAAWSALVIGSAIPLGGHYLADIIGGASVWLLWVFVERRWEGSGALAADRPAGLKASMAC